MYFLQRRWRGRRRRRRAVTWCDVLRVVSLQGENSICWGAEVTRERARPGNQLDGRQGEGMHPIRTGTAISFVPSLPISPHTHSCIREFPFFPVRSVIQQFLSSRSPLVLGQGNFSLLWEILFRRRIFIIISILLLRFFRFKVI